MYVFIRVNAVWQVNWMQRTLVTVPAVRPSCCGPELYACYTHVVRNKVQPYMPSSLRAPIRLNKFDNEITRL